MRVYHITNDVAEASGVGTFVRGLDSALRKQGVDSKIVTTVAEVEALGAALQKNDVVHIHGLWLKLHRVASRIAKKSGVKIVWSTHGMTAPWAMRFKWWKKLPAWWLYQKRNLKGAQAIHCTTEQEARWNKRLGLGNLFVAPLGCELSRVGCSGSGRAVGVDRVLLFVGRIHPVKGLVNLIRAWGLVVSSELLGVSGERWKLRIVGPDEGGHQFELESLVRELNLGQSIEFAGGRFGDELSAEYENCDCLVLPSFTENFGATVVDAMARGKPVITSTFTPWQEAKELGCGWWVSNEPKQLADAIMEMMALSDDERNAMGEKGMRLVEEKYTWEAVGKKMAEVYGS